MKRRTVIENKEYPLVSVVVICWNNMKFLPDFWKSLLSVDYPNIEYIFTDNGSTDASVDFMTKNYASKVTIIDNKKNLGFAEGNNVGIRKARGKYVLLLNNDTKHDKDFLKRLVDVMESDHTIGAATSKLLIMQNHELINGAGGDMILQSGDNLSRGFYMEDKGQFDKQEDVFGPSGACALYRKEMLDEIGLLDKGLHTYYEDVDLNERLQACGWRSIYIPSSVIYHYQSGTLDDFNPRKIFLLNRNKYYVILKNYPLRLIWFYRKVLFRSYLALMKHCYINNHLSTWIKINLSLLCKLPEILLKRVKLKYIRNKSLTNKFIRWIERHEKIYNETNASTNVQRYLEDLKKRINEK